IPDMDLLPPGIREWLESAYGHGIADIFLYVAPVAFLAFLVTLFIKEVPLKTSGALAQAAEEAKEKEKEKEQEAVPAVAGAGPVEAPEQPAAAAPASDEAGNSASGVPVRGVVRGDGGAAVAGAAGGLVPLGGRPVGRAGARVARASARAAP